MSNQKHPPKAGVSHMEQILKKRVFFIAKRDKNIFDAIASGEKRVETRAGTARNRLPKAGDIAVFICNHERIEKRIEKVSFFKSIPVLLKKYSVPSINPSVQTKKDLLAMYESFPGYKEKIEKEGVMAYQLMPLED